MVNFKLMFESVLNQKDIVNSFKQEWINMGNINQYNPDDLIKTIANFARSLNLSTMDDIFTASNPNAGIMDQETSIMFYNILETIKQRLGDQQAELKIIEAIS